MAHATNVIGGNYYNKFESKNPLARLLTQGFVSAFDALLAGAPGDVFEAGCGEGHLTMRMLAAGRKLAGCDIHPGVVAEAQKRVAAAGYEADLWAAPLESAVDKGVRAPVVVCCEVLEHVPEPAATVEALSRLADPYLVASVPREPIWRILNMCRGRYWNDFGNTPGHLQHWSSAAFQSLLSSHFEIIEVRRPLPWTMVLAKVKKR